MAALRFESSRPNGCAPKNQRGRWPQNERPVRGDNRTGQAIWALGVDGRSRRIQPRWGGITAPTCIGRGGDAKRSNRAAIFLTFWREFSGHSSSEAGTSSLQEIASNQDGRAGFYQNAEVPAAKLLCGRTSIIAHGRFVGSHGGRRQVQRPSCGRVLLPIPFFGGGGFRNRDDGHR